MEPRHIALVGKSHQLAVFELEQILSRHQAKLKPFYEPYFWELDGDIDPEQLIRLAGGTVKIYRLLDQSDTDQAQIIADDLISKHQDHFCLSAIKVEPNLKYLAQSVKKLLQDQQVKPHFQLLNDVFVSAGIVNKYAEYSLLTFAGTTHILAAEAVQNLDYWTQKDYGRPAFDASSGMLPPKVARMMINAALPDKITDSTVIFDPMCGSGTILLEGLDLGLNVFGSDLSAKAVAASTDNLSWFAKNYQPQGKFKTFQADATHVTPADIGQLLDAIVFEGYLGPPFPQPAQIANLIKGLEKLYKGVFKNLYPLLKPSGRLVCALPQYSVNTGVKNLDTLVDWTATLGYTRRGHFTYGRPQAFVKRSIYILQKKE